MEDLDRTAADIKRLVDAEIERRTKDLRGELLNAHEKIAAAGAANIRAHERIAELERCNKNQYDTIAADAALIEQLRHDLGNARQAYELLKENRQGADLSFDKMRQLFLEVAENLANPLRAVGAWQPIESAPQDGTWIVVWCAGWGKSVSPETARFGGGDHGDGWYSEDGDKMFKATHWMPIPEPPK